MTKLFPKLVNKRRIRERAIILAMHMIHDAIVAAKRRPADYSAKELTRLARKLLKECPSILKTAEVQLTLTTPLTHRRNP